MCKDPSVFLLSIIKYGESVQAQSGEALSQKRTLFKQENNLYIYTRYGEAKMKLKNRN